jgi:hypothetical protein
MLPMLRKYSAWDWRQSSRYARPATYAALAVTVAAAALAPSAAIAQRSKVGVGRGGSPRAVVNTSTSIATYHNDNQRTGLNQTETAFITSGAAANVNAAKFGKIWSRTVDGTIYTQPLFVPAVQFPNVPDVLNSTLRNGVYNAVFVATTHNSIYAFDAGGSAPITHTGIPSTAVRTLPLWHINFNSVNARVGPVPLEDVASEDLQPEIGIMGTPVIDVQTNPGTGRRSGTLFVVVKTKEGNDYAQRLHAIDITTGRERSELGSPLLIQASVTGVGDGSVFVNGNPTVFFDPLWENQQAALTLANGALYVEWGSHGDNGPFHGWVMVFSTSKLRLLGAFNTSPDASSDFSSFPAGAGIWAGGAAPAADAAGNLYLATGAGVFDASPLVGGGRDLGNTVLKLNFLHPTMPVLDYFTPNNWLLLSQSQLDLGSGGVMVLPPVGNLATPNLAALAGTEGTIYLMDRDNLGQFATDSDNVVQSIPDAVGPIYGLPAFFNNQLYYQGTGDVMKVFQFQTGLLNPTPVMEGTTTFGFPGATPSITTSPGGSNAIVWALERFVPPDILPGFGIPERAPFSVLHAYDANNIQNELFSSLDMGTRDLASSAVYTPATVVNGRAYIGGGSELSAFGNFVDNGVAARPASADHYIISGPDFVAQGTSNWYSITAIGPDGNPINATGPVHISARTFGGPAVNVATINLNGQSNALFKYTAMQSTVFEFFAIDDNGNSTYVPNIDQYPFGTLFPEISVFPQDTTGPDHLLITAPTSAKVGSTIPVRVTVVTATGSPYTWHQNGANFF